MSSVQQILQNVGFPKLLHVLHLDHSGVQYTSYIKFLTQFYDTHFKNIVMFVVLF